MKNILLCFVLVFGTIFSLVAQSRMVSGRVTSDEEPDDIPGVNVLVKGTMVGSITDIDGNYSLSVPEGSNVLVFSFVGFETQEINVGNRNTVNVVLLQDVNELSEVVITALGVERNRNELAYSAQEVDGDLITRTRSPDFVNSLSGKVAGLKSR